MHFFCPTSRSFFPLLFCFLLEQNKSSVIGVSDSTCDKCVWEMFNTFRLVVAGDILNECFVVVVVFVFVFVFVAV